MKDKSNECDCPDCQWERYVERLWNGIVKVELDAGNQGTTPEQWEAITDDFVLTALDYYTVDA